MDQRIINLYDDFVHTHLDRRLFLERAAKILGSMAAATALLPLLQSNYARAAIVAEADPRITAERVTYKGASGDVKAYLAKPAGDGKHGGIVVVHQNRGLNPHIEDVARRLATEGYVALAVDFLSQLGGTPKEEDEAMKLFSKLDSSQATGDALAGVAYLRSRPDSNGKVGAVGFCWGLINQIAVSDPTLNAAVVYYGTPPDAASVSKIKAALLLNYADPKLDTRLGALVPAYEEALKAAKIKYTLYYYEGANHAFNDDTQSARYNEAAAKTAWQRTLASFKENVA
ncbi:carboxymethylenebutenolidase [Rhizobiales bacterium GAS188]|nr:carboxymethylenebutenolidase [Rhizobiales bacterium GAS188]